MGTIVNKKVSYAMKYNELSRSCDSFIHLTVIVVTMLFSSGAVGLSLGFTHGILISGVTISIFPVNLLHQKEAFHGGLPA